ncbi:hypothetical protein MLD38_022629 [Melastoma candidum]|uniref:Uncharacterized protein n=1 Tax=Melastoma candidum TaxID=119954 RepID=A0ACB9QJW4_9MYRT|nr:hypothetical protein MLD38_022629 [Melastoma candidum]
MDMVSTEVGAGQVKQLEKKAVEMELRPWNQTGLLFVVLLVFGYFVRTFEGSASSRLVDDVSCHQSTFSNLNLTTRLCMKVSIWILAYSFPGHILGPPPKGTKENGTGPPPSNLIGSELLWVREVLRILFLLLLK